MIASNIDYLRRIERSQGSYLKQHKEVVSVVQHEPMLPRLFWKMPRSRQIAYIEQQKNMDLRAWC